MEYIKMLDEAVESVGNLNLQLKGQFANAYSENGFYKGIENDYWTTGFWTGALWLAWEHSGDPRLLETAQKQVNSFLNRIEKKIEVDHHDMGFLFTLSSVAGWKLIGNETAKKAALLAADQLLTRFHEPGDYIQAWGAMDDPVQNRLIIDSLLNMPLLHWACSVTGREEYRDKAIRHTRTTLKHVIREDASSWHTFRFHTDGTPWKGETCQGYRDGSAWTRGQAWGVFGTILSYRFLGDPSYLDQFRRLSAYYEEHLPEDLIPYWDLEFQSGEEQPRDSSSAAIVACAYLEAESLLPAEEGGLFRKKAENYLQALYDRCRIKDPSLGNGLLLHGTYSNHTPYNTCDHKGVDECTIWGDYFYMEALTRLKGEWKPYWYPEKRAEEGSR